MPFDLDEERRVVDPDRGLALTYRGGEKEGDHQFLLSGTDLSVFFRARRQVEKIEGADVNLPPPQRAVVKWRVTLQLYAGQHGGWTRESIEELVSEAMAVWRFGFGGPTGQLVDVDFER